MLRIMVLDESDLIESAKSKDLDTLTMCDVRVTMSELSGQDIVIYTPSAFHSPFYNVLKNRTTGRLADRIADMILQSAVSTNKNREEHYGRI